MGILPFFGNCFSQAGQNGVSELLLSGIGAVVGEMGLQNFPETLNQVQVRAICGLLDQMDVAFRT